MPATSHWHQRVPEIRAELAALETPSLDRDLVEQLFGFSRRQAIRLMATIEKPRQGIATVIARDRLLARLLATRPVQGAMTRKRQVDEQLATLERAALARLAPVTRPLEPAANEARHPWPHGISLPAPGVLTIRFGSAEELIGRVLALTEDAAADYGAFAARLQPGMEEQGSHVPGNDSPGRPEPDTGEPAS